jgi:hypothetical protein
MQKVVNDAREDLGLPHATWPEEKQKVYVLEIHYLGEGNPILFSSMSRARKYLARWCRDEFKENSRDGSFSRPAPKCDDDTIIKLFFNTWGAHYQYYITEEIVDEYH